MPAIRIDKQIAGTQPFLNSVHDQTDSRDRIRRHSSPVFMPCDGRTSASRKCQTICSGVYLLRLISTSFSEPRSCKNHSQDLDHVLGGQTNCVARIDFSQISREPVRYKLARYPASPVAKRLVGERFSSIIWVNSINRWYQVENDFFASRLPNLGAPGVDMIRFHSYFTHVSLALPLQECQKSQ